MVRKEDIGGGSGGTLPDFTVNVPAIRGAGRRIAALESQARTALAYAETHVVVPQDVGPALDPVATKVATSRTSLIDTLTHLERIFGGSGEELIQMARYYQVTDENVARRQDKNYDKIEDRNRVPTRQTHPLERHGIDPNGV